MDVRSVMQQMEWVFGGRGAEAGRRRACRWVSPGTDLVSRARARQPRSRR